VSEVRKIPEALQAKATILAPRGQNGYSPDRGGIGSNAGLISISATQRAEHDVLEQNLAATEETFREASDFLGTGKGAPTTTGRNHQPTFDELYHRHVTRGEKIIPAAYDEDEDRWILGDEYRAAWMAGYICQHCCNWQQIPHHHTCTQPLHKKHHTANTVPKH
jgi:hypothetical protein